MLPVVSDVGKQFFHKFELVSHWPYSLYVNVVFLVVPQSVPRTKGNRQGGSEATFVGNSPEQNWADEGVEGGRKVWLMIGAFLKKVTHPPPPPPFHSKQLSTVQPRHAAPRGQTAGQGPGSRLLGVSWGRRNREHSPGWRLELGGRDVG